MRTGIRGTVGPIVILLLVGVIPIGGDPEPADAPLTEGMTAAFGSAAWLPEEAAFFSNSLRLREQFERFRSSNAVQRLLALPTVQMGLAQLQAEPNVAAFLARLETDPMLQEAVALGTDAVSSEIFVYGGPEWVPFVDACGSAYLEMMIAGFQSGLRDAAAREAGARNAEAPPGDPWDQPPYARGLFATGAEGIDPVTLASIVVERADALRVPPTILGFRVSDAARVQAFLDGMLGMVAMAAPVPVQRESIGEGGYWTFRADTSMIPPEERRGLTFTLLQEGMPEEEVRAFHTWVESLSIAVSVGTFRDYLIVSVGPDTEHLAALGTAERTLAASDAFTPVRRRFKEGLVSLTYAHGGMRSGGKLPEEDCLAAIDALLAGFPPERIPEGLPDRLRADARALLAEVNDVLPEPSPMVSCSFANEGVETFTFTDSLPQSIDAGGPLSILGHAGPAPLLAAATRAAPSAGEYVRFVHWLETAYGYFTDYAAPAMSDGDREEYERFTDTFLPLVAELHETTQDWILPSSDGKQSLVLLDADGRLEALPGPNGDALPLPAPLRYPRFAILLELDDAERFVTGFARYRETVNRFVERAAEVQGTEPDFRLPAPEATETDGGTLYVYPFPFDLGEDFLPHARVAGNRLVIALSPAQSAAILACDEAPVDGVVDLAGDAGSAFTCDLATFTDLLFDDAEILLDLALRQRQADPAVAGMIRAHLPTLREVLGTMKSFSGRTYRENGGWVRHTWFRVEDLGGE